MMRPNVDWLEAAKVGAGGTANPPENVPSFLRKEPPAIYGWFSSGRLVVIKDGDAISLSRDDLAGLRDFVMKFAE